VLGGHAGLLGRLVAYRLAYGLGVHGWEWLLSSQLDLLVAFVS
jgi:hypothetical protein